jgi:hypothetical protein
MNQLLEYRDRPYLYLWVGSAHLWDYRRAGCRPSPSSSSSPLSIRRIERDRMLNYTNNIMNHKKWKT